MSLYTLVFGGVAKMWNGTEIGTKSGTERKAENTMTFVA